MTNERRSKRARLGANSNGRRAAEHRAEAEGPEALTERFAQACRLLGLQFDAGPVIVACSGGADSAAALVLLRRAAPKSKVIALYVNHQMRPPKSIARDIAAVRAQARFAAASVSVTRVSIGPAATGSPEERARLARYRVIEQAARRRGATLAVTGHQLDDLAETCLLALARGSGIDGITAMRPLRKLSDRVTLARPLMWATKAQCRTLVNSLQLPISEDETNADTRFARNAVRRLLASLDVGLPGAASGIGRSAALLADDRELLDRLTASAWRRARIGESNDLSVAALRKLPISLLRRVIRHAVATSGAGLRNFSLQHCAAIADAIAQQRGGRYYAGPATVLLSGGKLTVETPSNHRPVAFNPIEVELRDLPLTFATPLGTATLALHRRLQQVGAPGSAANTHLLDADALRRAGQVELRLPRTGDTCIPSGRTRPVSLARYLAKAGVPRSRREKSVVLCAGGRIAAALGHRVMEPFRPKAQGPVLELKWLESDTKNTRANARH